MTSSTTHVGYRAMVFALALVVLLPLLALATPQTAAASELEVSHTSLVPEIPRVDFPDILDGDVYAIEEIDNWIVAGGDFTQVRLADGTIIAQSYLVAFDKDTGALIDTFLPQLDGEVLALSRGANPGEILVGGRFNTIDGKGRKKLARLYTDGSVDSTWIANANAAVHDINFTDNGRLFIGGSFTKIDGEFIDNVAEIDYATGDVNTAFSFDFTGEGGWFSGGRSTRHVEALPGTTKLLVVHSANEIDGQQRLASAIFDVANPAAPFLTDYSINSFFDGARYGALPTNGDLSPDGSFYAMSTNIGDNAPHHDMVLAFPTTGGANTMPIWTHRMRDSVFAVGISNNAVYAGGHFCYIDAGPGATIDGTDVGADCTGVRRGPGIWRWQLAALDVNDGTPLDWDPGSNAGRGIQELTVTDRGLLIGHDGSAIGNRNVGRAGFMDFGAAILDNTAPTVAITSPVAGELVLNPFTVTGTAADDTRVLSVKVRIQDNNTGQWLQADGSFGAAAHDFSTQPVSYPGQTIDWSFDFNAPDGQYRVEARSIDSAGLTSTKAQFSFGIGVPAAPTCGVNLRFDDSVKIDWSAVDGEDRYIVRRDGKFLAVVNGGGLSYEDFTTVPGATHNYVIRSFQPGVTTNVDCGSVTIDAPPAAGCTIVLEANNDIKIDWNPVPGEDSYSVRRDGLFHATVNNLTYFVDSQPAPGAHSYIVRSKQAGVTTNIDCGTITVPGAPAPTCTAVVNANGTVDISWSALPGEDTYSVRRNGAFRAVITNGLAFNDDTATPGTHTYLVRSFRAGVQTNVDCGTVTL